MEQKHTTTEFDIEQYRRNTDALLDSMAETTRLFDELSENMTRLGDSFESFGETGTQLRATRASLADDHAAPVAGD